MLEKVWITGASSGIGAGLVRECSGRGADVVATARDENALRRVAGSCPAPVHVLPADLTDLDGLPGLVDSANRILGGVDALFLNAGVSQRATAVETSREVAERILTLNLLAPIELARLVLPGMIARGGGTIVVVTSLAGKAGFPLRSSYAASKHGLHGYFESLRAETADSGIRVTIAVPGFVRTDISRNALHGDGSPHRKMDENQESGISPQRCAAAIVRAANAGRLEVRPGMGFRGGLALLLHAVTPRLFARTIRTARPT